MQHFKFSWPQKTRRQLLMATFCILGIGLTFYYIYANWIPKWKQALRYNTAAPTVQNGTSLDDSAIPEQDTYFELWYPTDELTIPIGRSDYRSGSMRLRVPELAYEGSVMDGTSQEALKKGPGLYEQSPLPSYGNPNVCIAGHRGIYGAEFYRLDKLKTGSELFLEYDGYCFTYEFAEAKVVTEDNWDMIYCGEESSVTLTTCHPLSTSEDRLCVRFRLKGVQLMSGATPLTKAELAAGRRAEATSSF